MTASVLPIRPAATRADARTLSNGDVAKMIRRELRAAFPATTFRVVQARGSMVSTIRVRWLDGPSNAAVRAIVGKFDGKGFDGMTDSTFYRDPFMLDGELVSTYCSVDTSRSMSPRFVERVVAALMTYWRFESAPAVSPASTFDGSSHVAATTEQDREAYGRTGMWWTELVYRAAADRRHAEFQNA